MFPYRSPPSSWVPACVPPSPAPRHTCILPRLSPYFGPCLSSCLALLIFLSLKSVFICYTCVFCGPSAPRSPVFLTSAYLILSNHLSVTTYLGWNYLRNSCILCEIFLTLRRLAHAESPNGQMVGWAHKYKKRYCTLWFWRSENLASSKIRRKQSNGKRSTWCLYASYVLWTIIRSQASMYYICIGVGLSALLVSDGLGNARAFRTWNGQQDWLHAFFILCLTLWIYCLQEPKARYVFRLW